MKSGQVLKTAGISLGRSDLLPLLITLLVPFLVASPSLLDIFKADFTLTTGQLGLGLKYGLLPGNPYIDPNDGFITQAVGRLSNEIWLHGHVPWWNYFSGVGMPLAGMFQTSVFFPGNFLLLLPNGAIFRHIFMQDIAGIGLYLFARSIGLSRLAALTGGLLFSQNGSLAWFAHAPPDPACFLPWVLLGIEYATFSAQAGRGLLSGWSLLGLAVAGMVLAGFPETAIICLILATAYGLMRLVQIEKHARIGLFWRACAGIGIGVGLSLPQIISFADFLPNAFIGSHNGTYGQVGLLKEGLLPSLFAPYIFGPIFAYKGDNVTAVWDNIGGYSDLVLTSVALFGCLARRTPLAIFLFVWIILAELRIFAVPPMTELWNLIPGMKTIWFSRYAPESVTFALTILACFAIDEVRRTDVRLRLALAGAGILGLGGILYMVAAVPQLLPAVGPWPSAKHWVLMSVSWETDFTLAALLLLAGSGSRRRAGFLALLLVFDATILFAIPTLSTPRHGTLDAGAVAFLQAHIGLQRFYTLGPIAPNYGAYFQIASINHNYLPLPKIWVNYVQTQLDPETDPITFIGQDSVPGAPDALTEFKSHLPAFSALGVAYLVVPAKQAPLVGLPQAYADPLLAIFKLPNPAPYFDSSGNTCSLTTYSREDVATQCSGPARLLRREMVFPGWQARVNGVPAAITQADGLFQSVDLPAGNSRVTFSYAPPYILPGWCAFWLALALLLLRAVLYLLPDTGKWHISAA